MMLHIFKCPKCNADIEFRSFGFRSRIKCNECGCHFIVVKSFIIRMIETILLLALAGNILAFLLPTVLNNQFLTLVVFCIVLIVGNILFDLLMDKKLKYKNYYTLIEKTMPIKNQ